MSCPIVWSHAVVICMWQSVSFYSLCSAWPHMFLKVFEKNSFSGLGKVLKTDFGLESFGIWCQRVLKILRFQLFKIIMTTMWKFTIWCQKHLTWRGKISWEWDSGKGTVDSAHMHGLGTVSVEWLTTGGLLCTVSAKLLITEVSHGAGAERVRAYIQIVYIWLVLISEVDCHWLSINWYGTRHTSCI